MDYNNLDHRMKFAGIIKSLAFNAGFRMFGDSENDKEVLLFYFNTLKEYSIEEIISAGTKILKEWTPSKYYNTTDHRIPPISEFVRIIEGDMPKITDIAIIQANKIIDNLKSNGRNVFPPDIDEKSMTLMRTRWPYYNWAATVIDSELKWWVKEFCDAYRAVNVTENYKIEHKGLKQISDKIGRF